MQKSDDPHIQFDELLSARSVKDFFFDSLSGKNPVTKARMGEIFFFAI
jgi:hypothetical protein